MAITNGNLGPLTTPYSPSGADCHSIYLTNDGILRFGPNIISISSCQPSNFIPYDAYFYSPGICPSDQTYACFASLGGGSTAATCCPTGYDCKIGRGAMDAAACQSVVLSDTVFSISEFISASGSTISGSVTVLYNSGNVVWARGAVVRRANTDPMWATQTDSATLRTSTRNSNSPTSVGSVASRIDTNPTTDLQGRNNSTPEGFKNENVDTGLTTNAKIGIGVGVSLGVLLVIGAIITAFCIGKRKRGSMHQHTNQNYSHGKQEHQNHGTQWSWWNAGQYMGVVRAELEEQRRHVELYGRRSPVEIMTQ